VAANDEAVRARLLASGALLAFDLADPPMPIDRDEEARLFGDVPPGKSLVGEFDSAQTPNFKAKSTSRSDAAPPRYRWRCPSALAKRKLPLKRRFLFWRFYVFQL